MARIITVKVTENEFMTLSGWAEGESGNNGIIDCKDCPFETLPDCGQPCAKAQKKLIKAIIEASD